MRTKKSCIGLVKLSRLTKTRYSQSDTTLAWIMLHKMSATYKELKHQNTPKIIAYNTNLQSRASFFSPHIYQPTEPILTVELQLFLPDLQDIQPHQYQVWNCNKIKFDPNFNCNKRVFIYMFVTYNTRWRTLINIRWYYNC